MNELEKLNNTIALQYKQSVVVEKSTGKTPALHIRGLLLDISQLGYTLDGAAVRALRTLNEVEFKGFHAMLVENLKVMVGANVKYRALFKNFPNDIPDDNEYFVKRIVGYITNMYGLVDESIKPLSCGHVISNRIFNLADFGACPICQRQVDELDDDESDRTALEDLTPLKIIGLITAEDVGQIFTNLLAAKSSISEDNRVVITKLIQEDPAMFTYVPAEISMKENAALIAGLAVDYVHTGDRIDYSHVASDILLGNIKTATDVLRLAVQLSGGDVSLAEPTKFRLSNKQRRVIMWLLDSVNSPEEDMLRWKMRWIRLAEVLHIGKYAKKYPNAFSAIDALRNRPETIETFNSNVEALVASIALNDHISEGNLLELLATRPGEFARRMDWMLRNFKANKDAVFFAFTLLIDKLTTKMLLTLSAHFAGRSINSGTRYFMPKGNLAKIQVIEDERKTIDAGVTLKIVTAITNELLKRFSKLGDLGNVYINEDLKGYLVPLVQRNASKSLITVARGSHVALEKNNVVRMFLYWKQNRGDRVDVDLSAIAFGSDWDYKFHLSYTGLSAVGGVHSGDIQSAPNGAAEFIDLDIKKSRANGVRYIAMNVISYTGQPFDTFECFAGVMGRDNAGSGKKFEAKTVKHKFDVGGDTRYNIPLILDLETNKIIWADLAMKTGRQEYVEGRKGSIVTMGKAIESMVDDKPNMFDLLWLHAEARADSIDYKRQEGKEYDTVFDVDMASNVDEVLAKWL
jgi:hypothetical protein